MAKARDDVMILHDMDVKDFGKPGKRSRNVVVIEATPIIHNFDQENLGKMVAESLGEALAKEIRTQPDSVKPSTLKRRQQYARSISGQTTRKKGKGKAKGSGARKHYAGGKIGASTPNKTGAGRWLYDSGRLADNLRVAYVPKLKAWVTNVPGNRLREDLMGKNFARFMSEFRRRIKVAKIAQSADVQKSVKQSMESVIVVLKKQHADLKWQRLMAAAGLGRSLATLGKAVMG